MWMGGCDEEILVYERIAEAHRQAAAASLRAKVESAARPGRARALLARLLGRRPGRRDVARPAASGRTA